MYDFIFQTKAATFFLSILLSFLVCLFLGRPSLWLRSLLFLFGPAFAVSFFIVAYFYNGSISFIDITSGLIFELLVLIIYIKLLLYIIKWVHAKEVLNVDFFIKWLLIFQIIAIFPLLLIDGAGIYSDGSRINYFHDSSLVRYLTYLGLFATSIQAVIFAKKISSGSSFGIMVYTSIAIAFTTSFLAGSKGWVFLWGISILALIDYRCVKINWIKVLASVFISLHALFYVVSKISNFFDITKIDFAKMALFRFFLNNDGRALAFDFAGQGASFSELLRSGFRFIANILGVPSNDPPIGLLLNELHTGFNSGSGPNGSSMSLIIYYSEPGFAFVPVFILSLIIIIIYILVSQLRQNLSSAFSRVVVSLFGIMLIHSISQDILAMPLLVLSGFVVILFLLLLEQKNNIGRLFKTTRFSDAS